MSGLIGFHESWGSYWVNNHLQGLYIKDQFEQNKGKNILMLDSQKVRTSFLWETHLAIGRCLAGPLRSPFWLHVHVVGLFQPSVAYRSRSVQPTNSVRYQIPSSNCIVPTSHVTILLLHSVVPLYFFSHLMFLLLHWAVPNDRTFVTINGSFLFFIFFIFFYSYLTVPLSH